MLSISTRGGILQWNTSFRPRPPHWADQACLYLQIITCDTVEEKILQLQEKKRTLVMNLIATEASFFKSLTQEDVKALFD